MLIDVDRTLARWLGSLLPPGTAVCFGAPGGSGDGGCDGDEPFVAVFLHSVRREDQVRQSSWTDVRDERGRVVGRQAPLQHYRVTYLVTAWAPGNADAASSRVLTEHELLGTLIHACAVHEAVPEELVEGAPAAAGVPTLVQLAPSEPAVAEPQWSGWGISPRTYLRLDLLAPLLPPMMMELAPGVRKLALETTDSSADAGAGAGEGARAGG